MAARHRQLRPMPWHLKLPAGVLAMSGFVALAGCNQDSNDGPTPEPPQPQPPAISFAPCADSPELECGQLQVPLDHNNPAGGVLQLDVRRNLTSDPARGVLLLLSGGPGQEGQSFLAPSLRMYPPALRTAYQWVTLDTRGTGKGALNCPSLQAEVGFSDLRPASREAIAECAELLGEERRFYSTADTVADLELLRQALQVETLTLHGVSYGTYVASLYAVTHPQHVAGLVLDSPVPHTGLDMLMRHVVQAIPDNLREACLNVDCDGDPVAALATLIQQRHDSVHLQEVLVTASMLSPGDPDLAQSLIMAANGDEAYLQDWYDETDAAIAEPDIAEFSAGLHIATLCQDMIAPWGDSSTPMEQRQSALERAVNAVAPGEVWPFDHHVLSGQGVIANCLHWPPTAAGTQQRSGPLPDVPTLILSGRWDLSTPPSEAQRQLELAPEGRLVSLPDSTHSVASHPVGIRNVSNFLCGEPYPYPVPETAEFPTC